MHLMASMKPHGFVNQVKKVGVSGNTLSLKKTKTSPRNFGRPEGWLGGVRLLWDWASLDHIAMHTVSLTSHTVTQVMSPSRQCEFPEIFDRNTSSFGRPQKFLSPRHVLVWAINSHHQKVPKLLWSLLYTFKTAMLLWDSVSGSGPRWGGRVRPGASRVTLTEISGRECVTRFW